MVFDPKDLKELAANFSSGNSQILGIVKICCRKRPEEKNTHFTFDGWCINLGNPASR